MFAHPIDWGIFERSSKISTLAMFPNESSYIRLLSIKSILIAFKYSNYFGWQTKNYGSWETWSYVVFFLSFLLLL